MTAPLAINSPFTTAPQPSGRLNLRQQQLPDALAEWRGRIEQNWAAYIEACDNQAFSWEGLHDMLESNKADEANYHAILCVYWAGGPWVAELAALTERIAQDTDAADYAAMTNDLRNGG